MSGQREPRTNPPRKMAWKRALRLFIIAGVCFYRGRRYAVEDGLATMLADPDTRFDPSHVPFATSSRSAKESPVMHVRPVPTEEPCYVVSVTTVGRSVNWTGYLSYAVGLEHVGHRLYSCKG